MYCPLIATSVNIRSLRELHHSFAWNHCQKTNLISDNNKILKMKLKRRKLLIFYRSIGLNAGKKSCTVIASYRIQIAILAFWCVFQKLNSWSFAIRTHCQLCQSKSNHMTGIIFSWCIETKREKWINRASTQIWLSFNRLKIKKGRKIRSNAPNQSTRRKAVKVSWNNFLLLKVKMRI